MFCSEVKMEAAAVAVVRSPIGTYKPSSSVGGSLFLAANAPDFVRFPTKYHLSINKAS